MQMVFQDPYGALNPRRRVGSIIADPLAIHTRDSRADRRLRVQELMELVGLNPEHYNRFPNEFSGGQRQRIGVARALAMRPKLIVCDEPVSSLDVSIQAQILNLLIDLQSELGLTYVFIAHDLSVIRHVSDWVDVMYLGKIVERGPVADLFHSPRHPYTAALLAAIPVPDPDYVDHKRRVVLTGDLPSPIHPPPGCRFSSRCPRATDRCRSEEPMLESRLSDTAQHLTACHFPLADGEILASADTINLEAAPAVLGAESSATRGATRARRGGTPVVAIIPTLARRRRLRSEPRRARCRTPSRGAFSGTTCVLATRPRPGCDDRPRRGHLDRDAGDLRARRRLAHRASPEHPVPERAFGRRLA